MTEMNQNGAQRILVFGSRRWADARTAYDTLKQVEDKFRGPFVLATTRDLGAGRYAIAAARKLGWQIDIEPISDDCAPDCPPGHRRPGGPEGDYCPTRVNRWLREQLDREPDLAIALIFKSGTVGTEERQGQGIVRKSNTALWERNQRGAK